MSEKVANVQRKTLKDLQNKWGTIAKDHFKRLYESLAAWKQKNKEIRGASRLLCSNIHSMSDPLGPCP